MLVASKHQEVLSLLPNSLQKCTAKEGRWSPSTHLKTFSSKWPKQTAFHSGTRSGSSWRNPSFLSTSCPIGQEGRAHRTGHLAPPKGSPSCTTAAFPCGCQSLCRAVHIADKMLWCFLPYSLPPESFQLFGCMSESPGWLCIPPTYCTEMAFLCHIPLGPSCKAMVAHLITQHFQLLGVATLCFFLFHYRHIGCTMEVCAWVKLPSVVSLC